MRPGLLVLIGFIAQPVASQQIWDIWQTTWDRQKLFTSLAPSTPINFATPGPAASADIVVTETTVFQTINGRLIGADAQQSEDQEFGELLDILGHMFSVADGADASGFSYLRVPIGASDFSARVYSLDDTSGDTSFSNFNINNAPAYLFSVIKDILSINPALKVHILPWSPPAWMKTTGTMNGGTIQSGFVSSYPTYLLKAVQGFKNQGINIYAVSVQNEPENSNPTYPTCTMTPAIEGQIGAALRTLLNNNGLSSVKVVGYEHNWNDAGAYPVTLMQDDGGSYDGVAFHCYSGSVSNQDSFHNAFPSKNVYFTECSGTYGSDWWSDIKWYMDNLWIGSLEHWAGVGLMYNIALDGTGQPILPGTNSCGGGCRPLVTVNSDGSYSYNQEFYSMAQASKAIIPKDAGGPWGRRMGVSVKGSLGSMLRVGAYSTKRLSSTDYNRYSLVVMNWDDSASTTWNPVPVAATIEFRGMQAKYTFPVGVVQLQTTLWWFAAPNAQGLVTGFNATTVPSNATSSASASAKLSTESPHQSSSASAHVSNATAIPSTTAHLSFTSTDVKNPSANPSATAVPSSGAAHTTVSGILDSAVRNATTPSLSSPPASVSQNATSTNSSTPAPHVSPLVVNGTLIPVNSTTNGTTSAVNATATGRTH
ncbi:glycoside hydrolase [Mycena leptocephala]|nr:glycoside hydrolase [Mycena leptocephala]